MVAIIQQSWFFREYGKTHTAEHNTLVIQKVVIVRRRTLVVINPFHTNITLHFNDCQIFRAKCEQIQKLRNAKCLNINILPVTHMHMCMSGGCIMLMFKTLISVEYWETLKQRHKLVQNESICAVL